MQFKSKENALFDINKAAKRHFRSFAEKGEDPDPPEIPIARLK